MNEDLVNIVEARDLIPESELREESPQLLETWMKYYLGAWTFVIVMFFVIQFQN